jgi:hypothetical protein
VTKSRFLIAVKEGIKEDWTRTGRFEVFTAVAMKYGVFWDITPCSSCKNRCFGGM